MLPSVQERSLRKRRVRAILNSLASERSDNFLRHLSSLGEKMDSVISDLALDLGVYALDNEIENSSLLVSHSPAKSVLAQDAFHSCTGSG